MNAILRSALACSGFIALGAGCSGTADLEPPQLSSPVDNTVLAPTSATVTLGEDFYDAAGRRWVCKGKAEFKDIDPEAELARLSQNEGEGNPPRRPDNELTVAELAERLRPIRLVGGYEYQLDQPDTLVAEKILAMRSVPPTDAKAPTDASKLKVETGSSVKPQFIIWSPNDDRWFNSTTNQAFGHMSQGCTLTMIGPSTALSAAHCYYFNGAWVTGGLAALAANNWTSTHTGFSTPQGTYYADSLTMPGSWVSGAGSAGGAGTASSHGGWDDDYAVLEFSPTRYPGNIVGWYGTEWVSTSNNYIVGYPNDKWYRAQWANWGYYSSTSGARYIHYIDISDLGGESGACIYSTSTLRCTGIQSSHWQLAGKWNEARRWDATTYNFFDAYGNWP